MITEGQFCYWDGKSTGDSILLLCNLFAVTCLMIYCMTVYLRSRRIQSGKHFRNICILIILWGALYMISNIFSVVMYFTKFHDKQLYQMSDITTYSKIYQFIETIPAILIQWLLFYVPFKMISNIMHIYEHNDRIPQLKQIKVYQRLKLYQKIRPFLTITWILIIIPYNNPLADEIITQIKTVFLIVDCLICILALSYTRDFTFKKSQNLLFNNVVAQNRLKKQTTALTIACLFRFIMDFTYFIIFPFVLGGDDIACIEQMSEHLEFSIGYLFIGPICMHYLSVFVIIKMYQVGDNDIQNSGLLQPRKQIINRNHKYRKMNITEQGCR